MPEGGAGARGRAARGIGRALPRDPDRSACRRGPERGQSRRPVSWIPGAGRTLRKCAAAGAHANAMPAELVEALSKSANRCQMIWREARPASDFNQIRPALEELLGLVAPAGRGQGRRRLELRSTMPCSTSTSPAGQSARIDEIFDDYAAFLPNFLGEVLERQAAEPAPLQPEGPFAIKEQEKLAKSLMSRVGLRFRSRAARCLAPSFLRRCSRRCADHHALRRGRFHPGADGRVA